MTTAELELLRDRLQILQNSLDEYITLATQVNDLAECEYMSVLESEMSDLLELSLGQLESDKPH